MEETRIQLNEDQIQALSNSEVMPASIKVNGSEFTLHKFVAVGFKGAVWQVKDHFGRERAAKFAIYEDYQDRSYLEELTLGVKLEECPEFARFINADIQNLSLGQIGEQKFVCFIEDWVKGATLDSFLKKHAADVTISFFLRYVEGLCQSLKALQAVGLRHDDLHTQNVMLADPAPGQDGFTIKIIDLGSIKAINAPLSPRKKGGDHENFVEHLVAIYNTFISRKLLNQREQRFLLECEKLIASMLDDDASIALRDPDDILQRFRLASTRANSPRQSAGASLGSPFEYISAEHIADDQLLVSIFAASCPWLDKVSGPDPCLITGPRGCGKSTILRWLSLKAHLHKSVDEMKDLSVAGFYISCSSDLQNRLSWITTEAQAEKFRRELVHYFNLFLAREVVHTLCLISERADRESFWGMGTAEELTVYEFINQNLRSDHVPMQGVSRLWQTLEVIEREIFRCHIGMLQGQNSHHTTGENFIGDFTRLLVANVKFFQSHRIAFLVDDFSTHRLPAVVQRKLNRVIWERRPTHIFKLSSEKYGAELTDAHDATADVSREMLEVDCGREYLALDDIDGVRRARQFAHDLLANRLRVAKYAGTPDQILGQSKWAEGTLARSLRESRSAHNQYHGLECIADLCSGDISTLLLTYRKIFEKAEVGEATLTCVPPHTQHEAISSVSRELLSSIQHHFPHGKEMYLIVNAFGRLVRLILDQGKLAQGNAPTVCPRIEVDEEGSVVDDAMPEKVQQIARELVRRAVFIEMEPGRSRHQSSLTLRWQLRRVYLPAFGAALTKNNAVKIKPDEFKFLLIHPKQACEMFLKKWPKDGQFDDTPTTLSMFDPEALGGS